jgi:hypothetical protein
MVVPFVLFAVVCIAVLTVLLSRIGHSEGLDPSVHGRPR